MVNGAAETKRRLILDAIREKLPRLDPIMGDLTGLHIRIILRADGTPRVTVFEPECRFEST